MNNEIKLSPLETTEQGMLSIPRSADFLSVSESTIRRLMNEGEIRYSKIRRSVSIPIMELRRYAAKNLNEGKAV